MDVVEPDKERERAMSPWKESEAGPHLRLSFFLLFLLGNVFFLWLGFDSTRNISGGYWQTDLHQYRYLQIVSGRISVGEGTRLYTSGPGWFTYHDPLKKAGTFRLQAFGSTEAGREQSVFVAIWFLAIIYILCWAVLWAQWNKRRRDQERIFGGTIPGS